MSVYFSMFVRYSRSGMDLVAPVDATVSLPTFTVKVSSGWSDVKSAKFGLRIIGMFLLLTHSVISEMLGPKHDPLVRPVSSHATVVI